MDYPSQLTTERLLLRPWRAEDDVAFAALNADPEVREYFPSVLTPAASNAEAARARAQFSQHGFGFWAVEVPSVEKFIGFIGLNTPKFDSHFTPCVEIGWRLARRFWGHGYATEGARAALRFGFEELKLAEIVAFTVPDNQRSRHVMEKIGMYYSAADDFNHPKVPEGSARRRHVLYRLPLQRWQR